MQNIIEKIRTKNLKNADEKIITEKLEKILLQNPKLKKELSEAKDERSSVYKKIIKLVKQEMHRSYGAFQKDTGRREKLFEKLKNKEEVLAELLKTHSSTKERIYFYDELKQELSKYIKDKKILDLGCGLNPLMFDENEIIAVEFNKQDVDFLNEYFKLRKLKSKAIVLDLTKNPEEVNNFKVDVVFAWKLFDLLSTKATEKIVKNTNAKYLIASFSTKTLGNKNMNFPRRGWFQKMLRRLNLEYETKQFENELFYVIKCQ